MSNSSVNLIREPVGAEGKIIHLAVGASAIVEGIMVAQLDADATLVPGSTALSGDCIGVSTHAAAISGRCAVETDRVYLFANATGGDACSAATPVGWSVYMYDDHTIADNSNSGARKKAGIFLGMQDSKVKVWIHPGRTLAFTDADEIAIADAGAFTVQTETEGALQEIYQHLLSATGIFVSAPLSSFREVDANGDVGATPAGLLASDTTPIYRSDANESGEIYWAAADVDPIQVDVALPPDFSGAADAVLELWVASGTTDAATMVVETSWNGGAKVTDSADDAGTKSATVHKITATIAAADIPNAARFLTLFLKPPTHATNAILLKGWGLNGKRTLLTS